MPSTTISDSAIRMRASGGAVIYSNGSGASQLGCPTAAWANLVGNACLCTDLPVKLQDINVE